MRTCLHTSVLLFPNSAAHPTQHEYHEVEAGALTQCDVTVHPRRSVYNGLNPVQRNFDPALWTSGDRNLFPDPQIDLLRNYDLEEHRFNLLSLIGELVQRGFVREDEDRAITDYTCVVPREVGSACGEEDDDI